MISGRQIRAARGLLAWDAAELAARAGITRESISRIETDLVQPHEKTLSKILRAFDESGVEFTDNSGVRLKQKNVEILEDKQGFTRMFDYVYDYLKQNGGDVCISGVDERLFAKYRINEEHHRQRMRELVKARDDIKLRVLVEEGDYYFAGSAYATYMWQPKKHFSAAPFYVFGPYLALISFDSDPPPLTILIKSATFAEAYRHAFNIAWENAIKPPPQKTKKK